MNILSAIVALRDDFIRWPNERERTELAQRIDNQSRIPCVVGAIDGCHIIIKQPVSNAVNFYNLNNQHSIILQRVCDDHKIFTDIFIGILGRVHDARVFRNSPLFEQLTGNPALLPPNQHLIGDAAYPLLTILMKPFRNSDHLTPRQTRFNQVLSGQRSVIERAFGLLKGKWRRLKYLDVALAAKIPEVVLAACILHNFLLRRVKKHEYGEDAYNSKIMKMMKLIYKF
ncbi:hypothetical protein ILUMI_18717 [Ignelater luminosus]|uniref:DDE Tnp4 domain-containing protein n=1 Tax=Ignelater luminosus TaxID=2038154 RepID=A0A8K0CLZ3_IGNLU|nr:hypothetical protein ILUMI_18717 [Ignelater luminosus]